MSMNKDYCAGFFDGEGCVFVAEHSGYYGLGVNVTNTKIEILEQFKDKFGGNISGLQWRLNGKKCEPFLKYILPSLKLKSRQAELALQFIDLIGVQGKESPKEVEFTKELIRKRISILNQNLK